MPLLRDAEVEGERVDVRIVGDRIVEVGRDLPVHDEVVRACDGGALVPGLHDHHLHLLATAAAASSVHCGPPAVHDRASLAAALAAAPGGGWVRGTGYDEGVAGSLDRSVLDALVPDRPVRVQHRGGALWHLNSAALALVGPGAPDDGRLWRRDEWLRSRLPAAAAPSLVDLGHRLAAYGVTGVTDATPGDPSALAVARRDLPQRVLSLGDGEAGGVALGPRKIVLSDDSLPGFDELAARIVAIHDAGRAVAVHTVTRASLLLLLAVLAVVGTHPGDRLEHLAVAPEETLDEIARLGVAVVTQPTLVRQRGDDYLERVEPHDVPHLWRYASLVERGIPVAPSSDAPYGALDPWLAVEAAGDRRTTAGARLGGAESVGPTAVLAGYWSDPAAPGGPVRRVRPGAHADLALLRGPLAGALTAPASVTVVLTLVAGRVAHGTVDRA